MRSIVISCETNRPEIEKINAITGCHYPTIYLDAHFHDRPDVLKKELQQALNKLQNVDQVLLAMGYCGGALIGIHAGAYRIIIPKVDDCLTMFLGSMEKRRAASKEAATYFFTNGWLASERNIYREYFALCRRFGQEKADIVYEAMFEHYKRLGLIDTGLFDLAPQMEKVKQISDLLGLKYEILPGSCQMLLSLFLQPHGKNHLIIEPYQVIDEKDFSFMSNA